jgi:hypothetical protein
MGYNCSFAARGEELEPYGDIAGPGVSLRGHLTAPRSCRGNQADKKEIGHHRLLRYRLAGGILSFTTLSFCFRPI